MRKQLLAIFVALALAAPADSDWTQCLRGQTCPEWEHSWGTEDTSESWVKSWGVVCEDFTYTNDFDIDDNPCDLEVGAPAALIDETGGGILECDENVKGVVSAPDSMSIDGLDDGTDAYIHLYGNNILGLEGCYETVYMDFDLTYGGFPGEVQASADFFIATDGEAVPTFGYPTLSLYTWFEDVTVVRLGCAGGSADMSNPLAMGTTHFSCEFDLDGTLECVLTGVTEDEIDCNQVAEWPFRGLMIGYKKVQFNGDFDVQFDDWIVSSNPIP